MIGRLQFLPWGRTWPRLEKGEICLELPGRAHGGIHLEAVGKAGTRGEGICLKGDKNCW